MQEVTILTEQVLRGLVPLDQNAVQCIEDAFHALATKRVVMPPILRLDIPEHHGEVDVKTAYVSGLESFAVKIGPGFFDNPRIGLPSTSGLMVVLSSTTGLVQAVLLDNGYLTDIRTAAAGAVAAKHLARDDASIAAIIGAGVQAKLQLQALALVRPIREARLWARNITKAVSVAAELSSRLGFPVTAYADPRVAIAGSDVIVTTTPSTQPILLAEWLEPGQHLTAMGSDAEHKNEIAPGAIARADVYVADSLAQTRKLGELRCALADNVIPEGQRHVELGQLIARSEVGRITKAQITVADLTGTGIQDTAIATLAFHRAKAVGAGMTLWN
ncbi:ectoine utilization protein EutC [Mesorhizobium sp. NZP2077]|uniref:ectoine utilization protein EutC n=1 Tax=Mesorhizobium sp. NZP2077 TaxID=2483404 RepID=UPI00155374A0|nr:ectoine utilization protein EutC [Mesorhizobium sp. NZP2077]QKC86868.1 ectoine utilization protein EutC [Mesorhizobium sp. NZP2077]QKD20573.1 ectoine utilization protein EutC [Mesorhizobium sp. NZP2077]